MLCHHAECRIFCDMVIVIMLNVIMVNVIMLNVGMLNGSLLNVGILNVNMLSVIVQGVTEPLLSFLLSFSSLIKYLAKSALAGPLILNFL